MSFLEMWRFYLAFAVMWFGFSFLASWVGGWQALARRYPLRQPFSGSWHWVQAGLRFGVSGSVRIGSDTEGLYLSAVPIFRFGFSPIFVPWSDVTTSRRTQWFINVTRFGFRGVAGVPFEVSTKVAKKVLASCPTGLAA